MILIDWLVLRSNRSLIVYKEKTSCCGLGDGWYISIITIGNGVRALSKHHISIDNIARWKIGAKRILSFNQKKPCELLSHAEQILRKWKHFSKKMIMLSNVNSSLN